MSQTPISMASGMEKDDIDFRKTISSDLLNATFEQDSPAFNVEKALESVLEKHVESQDSSLHNHSYHHAAQVIRMIIKAWHAYKVKLGEDFAGYPLDGMDLAYTAAHTIGDSINNQESLPYKVRSCLTAEMKVHLNRHEFTAEKLQGIIDGACKAYLNIMAIAYAMAGEAGAPKLDSDPVATTATYTAVLANSPEVQSTKRKGPSSSSDDDQKEDSAKKPAKRSKKSTFKGIDDQSGPSDSPKPRKKGGKLKSKATHGESGDFQIIDVSSLLDPDSAAGRGSGDSGVRGQGNFNHGRPIKWLREEDEWARDQLRADPSLYFSDLAALHNEHWEGTVFIDGVHGPVTRAKRSEEAIQRRFVKFRQQLREAKKNGSATQSTSEPGRGIANPGATSLDTSGGTGTMRPRPDPNWMGGIVASQDGDGAEEQIEGSEEELETSDHDGLDDLEELERRMDAGESFDEE